MTPARQAGPFLLRTLLLFGLWMALVDTLHSAEIVAGAIAAPLCALLATSVARMRATRVRVRPAMLRPAPGALVSLFTETAQVTWALGQTLAGRRVTGRFRAVRSGAGGERPEEAGRRAVTEVVASIGPNRYVVGVDADDGVMLLHELVPSRKPLDPLERR